MNKQQYESLSDDLKLDAKLAIVLGKKIECDSGYLYTEGFIRDTKWNPRQDHAILLGLIDGINVRGINTYQDKWVATAISPMADLHYAKTKEEALMLAYCAADPQGNWAKWCKDNEAEL